jgi:hypothetical protein
VAFVELHSKQWGISNYWSKVMKVQANYEYLPPRMCDNLDFQSYDTEVK